MESITPGTSSALFSPTAENTTCGTYPPIPSITNLHYHPVQSARDYTASSPSHAYYLPSMGHYQLSPTNNNPTISEPTLMELRLDKRLQSARNAKLRASKQKKISKSTPGTPMASKSQVNPTTTSPSTTPAIPRKMTIEQRKFIKEELKKLVGTKETQLQEKANRKRLLDENQTLTNQVLAKDAEISRLQRELKYGRCYTTTPMNPAMWIWFDTTNLRSIQESVLMEQANKHELIKQLATNIESVIKLELVERKKSQDAFENKRMY